MTTHSKSIYRTTKSNTKHTARNLLAICGASLAFVMIAGSEVASARSIQDPASGGSYCVVNTDRGSICGFASLAQCEQTASGGLGECSRDPFREGKRWSAYGSLNSAVRL
jgi:hypothetical protein